MNATKYNQKLSNKKFLWPQSLKQYFSLPSTIIYYITRNPSTPTAYSKLTQSCKYFFEKNNILVVARIYDSNRDRKICSKNHLECYFMKNSKCCVDVSFKKLYSKIWLTEVYQNDYPYSYLSLSSKIYRCDNARLTMSLCEIKMEDFKLAATKFQKLYLYVVIIVDKDRNKIMLETILELLPYVQVFEYRSIIFNNSHEIHIFYRWLNPANPAATIFTIKNILNLNNLGNLRLLELRCIPETFDVQDIDDLIKNFKDTQIWLHFNVSDGFKIQLNQLIDTIIETKNFNCVIQYDGQNKEKFNIMRSCYFS